jgi:putative DNA primase/helicase
MADKLISPVPDNAPELPKRRGIKTDSGWINYDITHYWAYHSRTGEILGYTVRYETPEGKQVLPLTLWQCSDRLKWKFRGFPEPRPVFNQHLITHRHEAKIILVEGEKCCELLQNLIDHTNSRKFVSACWIGGAQGVYKIDWSVMQGRSVILWPDNDTPGRDCMLNIAGILRRMDCNLKIVQVPTDRPAGWDVGDFILDGADFQTVFYFIRDNLTDLPKNLPEPPEKRQERNERKPTPEQAEAAMAPFRCLGIGDNCFYYLSNGVLVSLRANEHTSKSLLSLAPLEYWERMFAGRTGPNWTQAVSMLMHQNKRIGYFDQTRLCGRGAFEENGKIIINYGNKLVFDNKSMSPDNYEGEKIFLIGPKLEEQMISPADNREASRYLDICKMILFKRNPLDNYLFAGHAVLAPFCGALDFRPHIHITGQSSSGKTWVIDKIYTPMLGNYLIKGSGSTTSEAGLRQRLGRDALPLLLDEAETDSKHANDSIQSIYRFARIASTGGKVYKGGKDGVAKDYSAKFMCCMSSIHVAMAEKADLTRWVVMELCNPLQYLGEEKSALEFLKLKSAVSSVISPEYCASVRARTLKLLPVIRKNITSFSLACSDIVKSARTGDLIGTLIAGAYSLTSDRVIDYDFARNWIAEQDLSEEKQIVSHSDEEACLRAILEHIVVVARDTYSIANLLHVAHPAVISENDLPEGFRWLSKEDAVILLRQRGLKVKADENGTVYIHIANQNTILENIVLGKTHFANSWNRILRRIPGAISLHSDRFAGFCVRSTCIPWSYAFRE